MGPEERKQADRLAWTRGGSQLSKRRRVRWALVGEKRERWGACGEGALSIAAAAVHTELRVAVALRVVVAAVAPARRRSCKLVGAAAVHATARVEGVAGLAPAAALPVACGPCAVAAQPLSREQSRRCPRNFVAPQQVSLEQD